MRRPGPCHYTVCKACKYIVRLHCKWQRSDATQLFGRPKFTSSRLCLLSLACVALIHSFATRLYEVFRKTACSDWAYGLGQQQVDLTAECAHEQLLHHVVHTITAYDHARMFVCWWRRRLSNLTRGSPKRGRYDHRKPACPFYCVLRRICTKCINIHVPTSPNMTTHSLRRGPDSIAGCGRGTAACGW